MWGAETAGFKVAVLQKSGFRDGLRASDQRNGFVYVRGSVARGLQKLFDVFEFVCYCVPSMDPVVEIDRRERSHARRHSPRAVWLPVMGRRS